MAVPTGWLVDPAKDTPIYFSFTPAQGGPDFVHQLRLPNGGAVISVIAQEELSGRRFQTLSEWAARDARSAGGASVPIRAFEMPRQTGVEEALISSYDTPTFGPDDQSQHKVNVFWELGGEKFVAHLLYPAGDPKGQEFERIFFETVRSVRPYRKVDKR